MKFLASFIAIGLLMASSAHCHPLSVLINTSESQLHHFTGGLGVMIEAYSKAYADAITRRFPQARVIVAMPYYMSFYDRHFEKEFTDEHREIEVELDYYYDQFSGAMKAARVERFHVYSEMIGIRKFIFYRHMNRDGVRNYFDNRVEPGARKIYTDQNAEEAFAVYCKAVAKDILLNQHDVKLVIENDWHTGLNAYFLKHPEFFGVDSKFVPRILGLAHNFAHQGEIYETSFMDRLGIDRRDFHRDGLMHSAFGKPEHLNLLKTLLNYSDMTATVSQQHAVEVLSPRFGNTLEGINQRNVRDFKISGVLNGIDYHLWNPHNAGIFVKKVAEGVSVKDYNFSVDDFSGKAKGKAFLQNYLNLPVDEHAMLIAFTSRLDQQKGYRYLVSALRIFLGSHREAQVAIIGDGPDEYRHQILAIQHEFPGRVYLGAFSITVEHLLLSYSDVSGNFSEQEPSGQVHTAAMRMGTVPIATAVGGHVEAIADNETGYLVHPYLNEDQVTVNAEMTAGRVAAALENLHTVFKDSRKWIQLASAAASVNWSWDSQIEEHLDLSEFTLMRGPEFLREKLGPAEAGKVLKPSELLRLVRTLKKVLPCNDVVRDQSTL